MLGWLRHAEVAHPSLHKLTHDSQLLGARGEMEVCTFSLGAKMGIGKNRGCGCAKCVAKKGAGKIYSKVVKLYLECGMDV